MGRRPATLATAVALMAAMVVTAPPAQADVSSTLVAVRTNHAATTQQSFSLPSGRHVVTAVMALTPRDPASQDYRCQMQAISADNVTTLVDETVVRVQDTVAPLPTVSNGFPTITLLGVVDGAAVLRVACTRVAGSGTAPRVDRLKVIADADPRAVASSISSSDLSSVIRNRTSGQVRALATVSLLPQDTTAGDLTCSLTVRPGGVEVPSVLDSTVVRVRQTPVGQGGTSNALPQVTLAGLGNAGESGEVKVFCTPGSGKQFGQPLVTRAVLVVHPVEVARTATASERPVVDGPGRANLWVEGRAQNTVVATVTLRPVSVAAGDVTCELVFRPERTAGSVVDSARVRVKALYDPDPLTSNAFPRVTLVAAESSSRPADYGVRCKPVPVPGYQQPIVERVTLTVTKTGSIAPLG